MITNTLIDTMWKEKTRADKIKETIQSAFCEIYRGAFDEIKELDEEQMYNSYMNSGMNTERMLSDNNWSAMQKNANGANRSLTQFNTGAELDEEGQLLEGSDIYDRATVMRKLEVENMMQEYCSMSPVKLSVENVVDDEMEHVDLAKARGFALKIEEPFGYERGGCDDSRYRISRRRSLTMTPQKNDESEDERRGSHNSELRSEENLQMARDHPFKLSFDHKFRTIEANNITKLRNITAKSQFQPKRALQPKSRHNNSIHNANRLSHTQGRKHAAYHTNSSFKHESTLKSQRAEGNEQGGKHLKSHFHEHVFAINKLHARNRSANSLRDKIALVDAGSFKQEQHGAPKRKDGGDGRSNVFNKKGGPFKHKL